MVKQPAEESLPCRDLALNRSPSVPTQSPEGVRVKKLWPLFIAGLVLGGLVSGEKTSLTAVVGARLIDGLGGPPRESSTILIEGRKIAAIGDYGRIRIPEGARVIDARGCTVIPGLINAHGHLGLVVDGESVNDGYTQTNVVAELEQYEQYGVTTMMSLGLNRDIVYVFRAEQFSGSFPGATIFTAGRGIG